MKMTTARKARVLNANFAGDQRVLLIMLRQMTNQAMGMRALAARTQLNRSQLYRTLSPRGNPSFGTMVKILRAHGMEVFVRPRSKK